MSVTYTDSDRQMVRYAMRRGPVTVATHRGHPPRTATLIAWDVGTRCLVEFGPGTRARIPRTLVTPLEAP